MLTKEKRAEFLNLISQKLSIVVTAHNNPDGDAVGSALGLTAYLKKKGHDAVAVVPNNFPNFYNWLKGSKDIIIYSKSAKQAQKLLMDADLVFCLDYNAINRFGPASEILERSPARRFLIDHHVNPELESFDFAYSTIDTSSTSELVHDIIGMLGDNELIDIEIAEALYTGIVTDTGSFSYAANREETYNVTANLISKGIDVERIHRLIYDTYSEDRLRLLGFSIDQRMIIWNELHTSLIYLKLEDLNRFNYQIGDIEGLVNYPLMMEKINVAVLLTERDNMIRISLRSKGKFAVNQILKDHFNGGGHRNAAGGKSFEGMDATIDKIKSVLSGFAHELDYKIE